MKKVIIPILILFASCGYRYDTDIEYNANDDKYEVSTHVWDNTFEPKIVSSKYNWKLGGFSDTRVTLSQLDSTVKAHAAFAQVVIQNMKKADSALSKQR